MCKKFLHTVVMKRGWIVRGQTTVFPRYIPESFLFVQINVPSSIHNKASPAGGGSPHVTRQYPPHVLHKTALSTLPGGL